MLRAESVVLLAASELATFRKVPRAGFAAAQDDRLDDGIDWALSIGKLRTGN
jgi:hypothetical protein